MINIFLLKTGLKDIYFYVYIWLFIRKNRGNEKWLEFNLRHDWVGRMYTVRSVPFEEQSLPNDVQKTLVLDRIKPMINWLVDNNLSEIIMPTVERIEETDSYLIKFSPLMYEIGFWWFVRRVIFACFIIWSFPYVKYFFSTYVSK